MESRSASSPQCPSSSVEAATDLEWLRTETWRFVAPSYCYLVQLLNRNQSGLSVWQYWGLSEGRYETNHWRHWAQGGGWFKVGQKIIVTIFTREKIIVKNITLEKTIVIIITLKKIIVTIFTLKKISVKRKLYPADRGGCEEEEASSCRGELSHLYNVHTAWFWVVWALTLTTSFHTCILQSFEVSPVLPSFEYFELSLVSTLVLPSFELSLDLF